MQLKEIRLKRGMTQKELAKLLFTSVATIRGWENNRNRIPERMREYIALKLNMKDRLSNQKSNNDQIR